MARIRNIKPDFFDDEGLATVSPWARLCFIGLWTEADREGRLEDRPGRLKARLFPFDAKVDVKALIDELVDEGCVIRYAVHEAKLLFIPRFAKHQYLSRREPASSLPGIDQSHTSTRPVLDQSYTSPTDMDQDMDQDNGHRTLDNVRASFPQPVPCIATGPHRSHAMCWVACVPAFLHVEFRAGLNNPDEDAADAELRAGYKAHIATWPEGKPTGDAIHFWRAWYRVQYPAPTAKDTKATKRKQEMDAWLNRDTEARA